MSDRTHETIRAKTRNVTTRQELTSAASKTMPDNNAGLVKPIKETHTIRIFIKPNVRSGRILLILENNIAPVKHNFWGKFFFLF